MDLGGTALSRRIKRRRVTFCSVINIDNIGKKPSAGSFKYYQYYSHEYKNLIIHYYAHQEIW